MPASNCPTNAMIVLLALLALGGLAESVPSFETALVSSAAAPSWVDPASLDPAMLDRADARFGSSDFEVLLSDVQWLATADPARQTRFVHTVVRLGNQAAVDSWSPLTVDFDPSFESVSLHDLRVLRAGVWQDRSNSRTWIQQPEPSWASQVFDERRKLVIVVDDLAPGDVLSFAHSVRGRNPVLGRVFTAAVDLGRSAPVERLRARVLAERSLGLRYRLASGAPEPLHDSSGGWEEWRWSLEGTPASVPVEQAPVDWWTTPWAHFSSVRSWNEVARWGERLYARRDGVPAALRPQLFEWRALSPAEGVLAAREWVQEQIRYTAVLVDQHALVPHEVGDTVARRYGDCKAKSLLLLEILSALDMPSWPVLVNTDLGRAVADLLPSPLAFDHVIVAAEVNGEVIWIDPTLRLQGGDSLDDVVVPDYGVGLPLRASTTDLVPPPNAAIATRGSSVRASYDLGQIAGPFEVVITTTHRAASAESLRLDLDAMPVADLEQSYLDFYSDDGRQLESLQALEVRDDRRANELVTVERYRVTGFPDTDPGRGFETLRSELPSMLPTVPASDEQGKPRVAPLALPHRARYEEEIELHTPPGWELGPVEARVENPWFRFVAETHRSDGALRIRYQLETTADRVPAEELERYAADVDRVFDAVGYSIVSKPPEAPRRAAAWALACATLVPLAAALGLLGWLSRSSLWQAGARS